MTPVRGDRDGGTPTPTLEASGGSPSYLFNAQQIPLTCVVNCGLQLTLDGTGSGKQWMPQSTGLSFSPQSAGQGDLKWYSNTLLVWPRDGSCGLSLAHFTIPDTFLPSTQFQIYVYWRSGTTFDLYILADGTYLGQTVTTPVTAPAAELSAESWTARKEERRRRR